MVSASKFLNEQAGNQKVPVSVTIPILLLEEADEFVCSELSEYPWLTRSSLVSAALAHYLETIKQESPG